MAEKQLKEVIIKFAGDSGDGMQLAGSQFTDNTALMGFDLATFPDFPAEIRAPKGTLAGVSGFQLRFSGNPIYTPGDEVDVLIAMNAAALRINLKDLKENGILIADIQGFDAKNLKLAKFDLDADPLENCVHAGFDVIKIDMTKITRELLKDSPLGMKDKDRARNMFVLGFVYWMYQREMDNTISFLKERFKNEPEILDADLKALNAGYNYGITTEAGLSRYSVARSHLPAGTYRNIRGNKALALGLVAAAGKAGIDLFLGSYPITPASDILHELSKLKNFGVKTFQAEDEIASISAAIGASYGGALGATTTSGPGMALKTEAMGLAVMLELPLVIIDVQRGGPSTGLPTKTEQSDLMQAIHGRNGESPIPVIAAKTPSDCFDTVFEAARIAIEHMTPVIMLSDGYLGNGAEPWKFPTMEQLPEIKIKFQQPLPEGEVFHPYIRDERKVRPWAIPGTPTLENRIGGLEKEDITGNVSYDPENHEKMVKTRQEKVDRIADFIPDQEVDNGPSGGDILVIGWGSTYGAIKSAVAELLIEGESVAHVHLRYLYPFPKNLGSIIKNFEKVIVPELNNGQLVKIIRNEFLVDAKPINKIQGKPFTKTEIIHAIREIGEIKD